MDDYRSFVAEPGWYHEAYEAFVPDRNGGRRLFLFQAAEKALLQRSRSFDPFDVLREYAPEIVLSVALSVERRVSARRGWVGENGGLFEHPDGSMKEEKPWNG